MANATLYLPFMTSFLRVTAIGRARTVREVKMKKLKGCGLPMAFDLPPKRKWGLRHIPNWRAKRRGYSLTTARSTFFVIDGFSDLSPRP
jgi:hypothetical protein